MDCKNWQEFSRTLPDEGNSLLEEISDLAIQYCQGAELFLTSNHITITGSHRTDALNYTFTGTVDIAGKTYYFVIESGNRMGTYIERWDDEETATPWEPPEPSYMTFVPPRLSYLRQCYAEYMLADRKPATAEVFWAAIDYIRYRDHIRQADWFKDLVQSYNYDRYFAPGPKTENYFREKAAGHKLIVINSTDLGELP